jgi:hypothetical protein
MLQNGCPEALQLFYNNNTTQNLMQNSTKIARCKVIFIV